MQITSHGTYPFVRCTAQYFLLYTQTQAKLKSVWLLRRWSRLDAVQVCIITNEPKQSKIRIVCLGVTLPKSCITPDYCH